MDRRALTDFSIQRILSPQLGLKPAAKERAADGSVLGIHGAYGLDHTGSFRPPAPAPGCLQCRGMSCGEALYPYGGGLHHFSGFYPADSGVYLHFSCHDPAGSPPVAGYHGYHQDTFPTQPQPQSRQRPRMRTVFTDSQTKQLEALFDITEYPSVEARAEVARSSGLSEETIRVWFKNRRARRKRQCSGPKVKSPSPMTDKASEKKLFSSFL